MKIFAMLFMLVMFPQSNLLAQTPLLSRQDD